LFVIGKMGKTTNGLLLLSPRLHPANLHHTLEDNLHPNESLRPY
jgi:hypothetical protein